MEEFNSFVKEGEVYLKAFLGAKANQLNYQTTPAIQGNNYDAAAIHVGINDLLSSNKSVNDICRDIISIGLRCRSNNISNVFISSIAYSSKINTVLMQRLNRALCDECRRNGFTFVDSCTKFDEQFLKVLNIHVPLKRKLLGANHALYISKILRKAILRRSYLEKIYLTKRTDQCLKADKKQKNYCSRLYKKERKNFFSSLNPCFVKDNMLF